MMDSSLQIHQAGRDEASLMLQSCFLFKTYHLILRRLKETRPSNTVQIFVLILFDECWCIVAVFLFVLCPGSCVMNTNGGRKHTGNDVLIFCCAVCQLNTDESCLLKWNLTVSYYYLHIILPPIRYRSQASFKGWFPCFIWVVWKAAGAPTWKVCVLKHRSGAPTWTRRGVSKALSLINLCLFYFRFSFFSSRMYMNPESYISISPSLHSSLFLSPGLVYFRFLLRKKPAVKWK